MNKTYYTIATNKQEALNNIIVDKDWLIYTDYLEASRDFKQIQLQFYQTLYIFKIDATYSDPAIIT